jgi:flagellar basal-body rod protein FlgB
MPLPTGLFDGTIAILQRSLNLRSAQHQVLSANVANADTPRYSAFEVAVDEEMRKARPDSTRLQMAKTSGAHLPAAPAAGDRVTLRRSAAPAFSLRADGNTVDIDRSMGDLAENAIKYKTSAQMISAKFKTLRNVIQGGK